MKNIKLSGWQISYLIEAGVWLRRHACSARKLKSAIKKYGDEEVAKRIYSLAEFIRVLQDLQVVVHVEHAQ